MVKLIGNRKDCLKLSLGRQIPAFLPCLTLRVEQFCSEFFTGSDRNDHREKSENYSTSGIHFFVSDDIASDRLKIIISDKKIMDAIRPPSRIDRLLE